MVTKVKATMEGQVKEKEFEEADECGERLCRWWCGRDCDGAVHEIQGLNSWSWDPELWLSCAFVVRF